MTGTEEMVTFRLAPRDRAAIQRLVDEGEFRNRSDFLRYAIKATLGDYGTAKVPLDLEMEQVDLPPSAARPRARSPRKGISL